jgi:hypothetical protein
MESDKKEEDDERLQKNYFPRFSSFLSGHAVHISCQRNDTQF